MADCWRPPDYDGNRCGSYPNPTRDHLPQVRPGPVRSFTMDPSRDPRKRRPSRSPEGGIARKQFKNGDSLPSSDGQGPPRHPRAMRQSPDPRLRKSSLQSDDRLFVNSPFATSLDEDTSGRSTPHPKSNGVANSAMESNPDPVAKMLTNFASQVAAQASLQIARDQAEARVNRAKLEYGAHYSNFNEFPAIKEAKRSQRHAAQKDLDAADQALRKHVDSQADVVNTLAQLIDQNQQPRTDQEVSRVDFDNLSSTCRGLQVEVTEAKSALSEVKSSLDEAKSTIKDLKVEVTEAKSTLNEVKSSRDRAESTIKDLTSRLAGVGQTAEATTRKQLDSFKEKELYKFATKEPLKKLETQCARLTQDLSDVKASVNDDFVKQVHDLAEQGPALLKRVDELEEKTKAIKVPEDKLVDSPFNSVEIVEDMQQQLEQAVKTIQEIKNEAHEEGKEPIVKRVKHLDVLVNNLTTEFRAIQPEGKPSIQQQLSQFNRDQEAVKSDVIKLTSLVSSQVAPSQPGAQTVAGTSVDLAPSSAQLDPLRTEHGNLRAQLDQLRTEFGDRLSIVETDLEATLPLVVESVAEHITPLQMELEESSQDLQKQVTKITTSLALVHKNQADFKAAVASAVSSKDLAGLRDHFEANYKKVYERVQKLENAAQHVSPAPNAMPAPARHSSPQNNGVPQQLPPNFLQEWKACQAQITQLVNVFQHLKHRFDNLQSDEVVRMMVDQMAQIYPHPKNFEAAVQEFRMKDTAIRARLDTLQAEKNEIAKQVVNDVQVMRQDFDLKITRVTDDISKENALSLLKVKSEVQSETLKVKVEITETLDKHSDRLDGHDKMCRIGEQKINDLGNDQEAIMKRVANYEGKIERLAKRNG